MTPTTADRRPGRLAVLAALMCLAASPALAQWRDGGGRDGGGRGERGGRAEGPRRPEGGPRGGYGERGGAYGEREGGDGWRGGQGYGPPARAYAPPPQGYGDPYGGRSWRRGQVLPPDYRGATVADPGRYHLRRPPSGYDWVGDSRNAYLMQRSTGLVLDSVTGAYDPPPPYRGRRPRR